MHNRTYNGEAHNGRSIGEVVADLKAEFRDYAQTRAAMLKAEIREKVSAYKTAIPVGIVAAVFAWIALNVITFAIVAAIAPAFQTPWNWAIAAAIVGGAYLLIAAVAGWFAYREITAEPMAPERTLRVLSEDKTMFQNERAA